MPNRLKFCFVVAVCALLLGCVANGGSGTTDQFVLPSTNTTGVPSSGTPGGSDAKASNAGTGDGSVAGADTSSEQSGDTATTTADGSLAGADGGPKADAAATIDSGGKPLPTTDKDQDGYSPAQGDCDDTAPGVYPGQSEWCNDVDDDCNGQVDDLDSDKDGFSKCPGAGQDCDDSDAEIYPGALSACAPGKDGDCDGIPDLEVDNDNDGHPICADCDDKDPLIFPGAKPICTSKKDNNCDGMPDNAADKDKDGDPTCSDCDDNDPAVYVLAPELCNKKDDDCNGVIDDKDDDGDGYSGCNVDCNDKDITINPGAGRNCKNNKDNDCNGKIDAQEDGDGDGFIGCQDCNDYNALVNPGGIELGGDNIDNDCDGGTDELPTACDNGGLNTNDANDFAKSIDLCVGVQQSTFVTIAAANSKAIKDMYGPPNKPIKGKSFVCMSSGVCAAAGQPGYVLPQGGTSFSNTAPNPSGKCMSSGSAYDYTEWKLTLKVPGNAQAFSFDFNFMSSEFPEWVGSQFNDKFMAILDSQGFKGNVSFDSKGSCISINNALFDECNKCKLGDAGLKGTGYEGGVGGGTGWLTTTAPVKPNETITLRFIVFDESDHILDSAVLIDNFRWLAKASTTGPSTVRPGG